jgi:hypothetical protein
MVPLLDGSVLLAWVTSRVAGALLAVQLGAADETSSGAASKSYEVGLVGRLPWPRGLETERKLAAYAAEITTVVKDLDRLDETTHSFVGPNQAGMAAGIGKAAQDEVSRIEDVALMAIRRSAAIEEAIMSVIGSDAPPRGGGTTFGWCVRTAHRRTDCQRHEASGWTADPDTEDLRGGTPHGDPCAQLWSASGSHR